MEEKKEFEKQTVFKEDDRMDGQARASKSTGETSIGLSENIAGLLAYLFTFISGILFLFIEKENKFVRFHAMQSIILFGSYFIVSFILGFIPILGLIIAILAFPLGIIIAIFLMYKAYQGEMYKFPIVGDMAEQWLAK